MWASLGPTCFRLSELPELVYFFPSPDYGSFWSLFLQITSWSLVHSLLLMVLPWCKCCYISYCPKDFLSSPHFFKILFSFCCSAWVFFHTLSSKSLIWSSASSNLLFMPSSVLLISDTAFFISDWSFLYISYVFFSWCGVSL